MATISSGLNFSDMVTAVSNNTTTATSTTLTADSLNQAFNNVWITNGSTTSGFYNGDDVLQVSPPQYVYWGNTPNEWGGQPMGQPNEINGSHLAQVRKMREEFPDYSKADFRKISKRPLVKEILSGLSKVPASDVADRIRRHVELA